MLDVFTWPKPAKDVDYPSVFSQVAGKASVNGGLQLGKASNVVNPIINLIDLQWMESIY